MAFTRVVLESVDFVGLLQLCFRSCGRNLFIFLVRKAYVYAPLGWDCAYTEGVIVLCFLDHDCVCE